jgi:hypothetical protein
MEWIEVGWNGLKWGEMGSSGMEWVQVGRNGLKWDGMGSSGMEWFEVGWNGFKWDGMGSSGMEWIEVGFFLYEHAPLYELYYMLWFTLMLGSLLSTDSIWLVVFVPHLYMTLY